MSKANRGRKRRKWSNMTRPNARSWPCSMCGAMCRAAPAHPDYRATCDACKAASKAAS